MTPVRSDLVGRISWISPAPLFAARDGRVAIIQDLDQATDQVLFLGRNGRPIGGTHRSPWRHRDPVPVRRHAVCRHRVPGLRGRRDHVHLAPLVDARARQPRQLDDGWRDRRPRCRWPCRLGGRSTWPLGRRRWAVGGRQRSAGGRGCPVASITAAATGPPRPRWSSPPTGSCWSSGMGLVTAARRTTANRNT